MASLIAPTGHTLDLPDRHVTFGASPACDIPLSPDYGLASLHFEIAPAADGTSYLRDASEGAGTLINGRPVSVTALQDGDIIQAGQLTLHYAKSLAAGAPSSSAPESEPASPVPAPAPVPASAPAVKSSVVEPRAVQLPAAREIITAAGEPSPPPSWPDLDITLPASRAAAPVMLLSKSSGRSVGSSSPLFVRIACGVLLLIAAAAFCATDPGQRLISPLITHIHQWNTARAPKPKAAQPALAGIPEGVPATNPAPASAAVIPQTPHQEISRALLTERTQTLIYADLRQLIPTYNLMASQQGLPSQREMSEAFRRTYGTAIDSFEQLSVLQADTPDDFLLVLTGPTALNLEKIIGQPARAGSDGRPHSRIYQVKAGNRSLSAALYDPFTLLLGNPRAVTRATQPDAGPQLREARCMFPTTAHRNPGALIIVKRVNLPAAQDKDAPVTAFETTVTNLFLEATTSSTLTLTRNPEVREQAFVDAAAPALKEQTAALSPPSRTDRKKLPDLAPGEINLTVNEASVALPGGAALISSALETMARSFARAAPSMSTILQAQDAVMRFNSARSTGSDPALRAGSPREALELLNEGIRGGGRFSGATFQLPSKEEDLDDLSSLLALDEAVGLVYRPDSDLLSASSLDLAVKARNYRNAELLIGLWQQAKLTAAAGENAASASRRILVWAATPAGRQQRSILGLPSLTPEELAGALAHLSVTNHQLGWKPDATSYRSWVRLVHPDPRSDAARLAATFNAAAAAGAIPSSATKDLKAALSLITRGVTGRGRNAGTSYKLDAFTPAELASASALLTLDDGTMKVAATPVTATR